MAVIQCVIPGRPLPCPRPRATRGQRAYYPSSYRVWMHAAQTALRQAAILHNKGRLLTGPLQVEVTFRGAHPLADLDNLVKAVLDAGNGQLWEDDKQVEVLRAVRLRDKGCETALTVAEVQR